MGTVPSRKEFCTGLQGAGRYFQKDVTVYDRRTYQGGFLIGLRLVFRVLSLYRSYLTSKIAIMIVGIKWD